MRIFMSFCHTMYISKNTAAFKNVYCGKRGHAGVKQCIHSFYSFDCLLSISFCDYVETNSEDKLHAFLILPYMKNITM